MKKNIFTIILSFALLFFCKAINAQDYQEIWKLINENKREEASKILEGKIKNKTNTTDEYLSYFLLKFFDGTEDEKVKDFLVHISKSDNPEAYIYALWFNDPVVGDYGHKTPEQLALLKYLIAPAQKNGTLRAAAHYSMGHYYIRTHQFSKIKKENEEIGALSDWQFVGPFSNISGSGFNKDYEPVKNTSNETEFLSVSDAPIKWFTPIEKSYEGWVFPANFITESGGNITYAQTFVNSPVEQEVILCTGFSGNIKIWVNDELILKVSEDRLTELDAYKSKCKLKAGYNRILVQAGADYKNPNFIIRLTDQNYDPIKGLTSVSQPQTYSSIGGESLNNEIPLFAETYFINKIKSEPDNIINYVLLNRVYIRSKKVFEARQNIEKALVLAPNNSLLKYELSLCYLKENNKTGLSEVYEYFKEKEKQSLISYILRAEELTKQEKYQEVIDETNERIKLYGSDETSYETLIQAYANLDDAPTLIKLAEEAYENYPTSDKFANYMFTIHKNVYKNPKKALSFLAKYLSKNWDYSLSQLLVEEYFSQQNPSKAYSILNENIKTWPYDPDVRLNLLNEYLSQQKYTEAYALSKFMLKMKPYSGYYYQNKAQVEEALTEKTDAVASYQTAFKYEPSLYESREKQRRLQGKKPIFEEFKSEKIEDLIKNTGKGIDAENYDFYYLQYETNVVMYPEGGREELHTSAVKILTQRGIDRFSDFSLPYNYSTENLIIEDAQLIKANGKKTKPEISGSQIVWTGLEVGDYIYFKYKIRAYQSGKFAKEYYDQFEFDGFIPVEVSRFSLIIPKSRKVNYKVVNGDITPKITEFEDNKIYVWEKNAITAIKEEPYMPPTTDFSSTLHISTLDNWNDIAQWYSDLVYSKIATDNDFEVTEVYKSLFEGKKDLTATQKAKIIYDYIAKNINYSSVSFRQSGLIPQKASTTINTHLGDCKDISTLFVSLGNMCGLKSNLVLVSTRDNGQKSMVLPSFLFNHCIVKYYDEKNTEHYLELTNRELPFKSLPNILYHAVALTIPAKENNNSKYDLEQINTNTKTNDKIVTNLKIDITNNDMNISCTNIKYGALTSSLRSTYRELSQEKTFKKMQESMGGRFSNPVKINDVSFVALDECLDTICVKTTMSVKNEIKKIGNQSAFTIPFTDVILTASPFNLDERKYDFEYWDYESVDDYVTEIEINLPADKSFVETPKGMKLNFKTMTYSIDYIKVSPTKLKVVRKAHMNRNNITPTEYQEFKNYVTKIVDTEGAYVTFK